MAQIYYDDDADLSLITSRRIGVIGYGNQGQAQALNLRDSGCDVRIGLRPEGRSWAPAVEDGFTVETVSEAAAWADVVNLLLPEQHHRAVYEESVAPRLGAGKVLMVAHGFSILSHEIMPPPDLDVSMVAPVGPGHMMRRLYESGLGEPALLAVHQDASGQAREVALAYAAALGCTRAGVVETTFREETEANLFGEQAVLCGGVPDLLKTGFNTLVHAGYQPEVAYFECVHTMKLIVDLIYEGGFAFMRSRISDTAAYGSYLAGPQVVDTHVTERLDEVLREIQSGAFASKWIAEFESGAETLQREREQERLEGIEQIGSDLRSKMPWLAQANEGKQVTR